MGIGVFQNDPNIVWRIDGAAMGQENNILIDRAARFYDLLCPFYGEVHIHRCAYHADGPAYGGAHMGYDGIGTDLRHLYGLLRGGYINTGEKIHLRGQAYHIHLFLEAHPGLFEDIPKVAVNDGMGRKVIDPRKSHGLYLLQEMPHAASGI